MTKVLVVDDQEDSRYLLQVLLGSHGYEVGTAEDGASALEAACRNPPDLVLSDILMPKMDGFSLCRAWVKDRALQHIPFVFYTATYTGPDDERFGLSLGATRFIVKPMEPEPFLAIIDSVLQDWAGGRLVRPEMPLLDEEVFLKTYNDALIRKLEDKVQELEAANRALVADIAARIAAENTLRLQGAALASAADAIVITDSAGDIVWVNPAFESLTGYRAPEVAGKNLRLLRSGKQGSAFYRRLWDTILAGETWRGEMVNRRKDGTLYSEAGCITPVHDASGAITHFVAIKQDISKRKRTEMAERDQRALAEALRATAAALTSTLSFDDVLDRILIEVGRVVPHDAARIILVEGGLARTVRSRGYVDLEPAPAFQQPPAPIDTIANLGAILQTGLSLAIADTRSYPGWADWPQTHWVRSNASAPIKIKGEVIGFLGLDSATAGFYTQAHAERLQAFADQAAVAIENARLYDEVRRHAAELEGRVAERTAELTQREEALQTANEKLTELDRMKSQFVSNVSHELRTPLANISTYLSLLECGRPEKHDRYMETLHREANLLARLIEDLLQLSRLELGMVRPELRPVDVNRLVTLLVGDRALLFANRGLTLEASVEPGLAPVQADEKMLTQVLTNLMTNAMNYTPAEGKVIVSTHARRRGEGGDVTGAAQDPAGETGPAWVTLSVADTGPGISAEDQARLFERFYRGEAAHQSGAPGTGLGLAISQELVARHCGHITVESEVGHGSTFSVWLPVASRS